MALPSWPADVPYRPMPDSWRMEPYLAPIKTEMDGGNVRLRRRPGDNVATISQTINMTLAEWDSFESFLREDLHNGASRFTAQVWTGSDYVSKTCQFVEVPTQVYRTSGHVVVAMTLRVYGM